MKWFLGLFLLLGDPAMAFELKSSAFSQGAPIPSKYTCDGADASPHLTWSNPPEATKCYVLIADDPDAPVGTWVHWVVYNIPKDRLELPEGIPTVARLTDGSEQGINDFKRIGYGGPCPPRGAPHRYFFKLYALDRLLTVKPDATKSTIESAMKGHILAEAKLVGTYQRK